MRILKASITTKQPRKTTSIEKDNFYLSIL